MSASETTFSHYNLKIFTPKVTKNITNLCKKFCEFPSSKVGNTVFDSMTHLSNRPERVENIPSVEKLS